MENHLKVIIWLYYGSEGAAVLIEPEAVFVMKDVCIMEYHSTWAIISAFIKDWKKIELACALGRNLDCDKWGLDSMGLNGTLIQIKEVDHK